MRHSIPRRRLKSKLLQIIRFFFFFFFGGGGGGGGGVNSNWGQYFIQYLAVSQIEVERKKI